MADGIFFKNQNKVFDKLFKDIKSASDELIKELDAEMGASIEEMATSAKQMAPVSPGGGRLRASINVEKVRPLVYYLNADVNYAAYVEFGTGPAAKEYVPTLDSDWQEYAKSFQKSTPGHTPVKKFFYPSITRIFPIMIKRMENIIKG